MFKALQMLLHLHHQGEGSGKSRGSYGGAAGGLAPYSSSCPRRARRVSSLVRNSSTGMKPVCVPRVHCTHQDLGFVHLEFLTYGQDIESKSQHADIVGVPFNVSTAAVQPRPPLRPTESAKLSKILHPPHRTPCSLSHHGRF